ncbi:hypothetical protein [Butyrivibrio sp. YAB3001]|uniref:hypothetical protein n=1 Tax=Butyrivibrio sp. YAB3001 TaxID=1520812 RepID=UPI0008F68CFB|nr:hypothetical protein [Butyrivibrio sp. YAB3001]SFC86802.1 hypothetical protein SAMN02910398_03358 [Butyrivibrio sp. YAB3001]
MKIVGENILGNRLMPFEKTRRNHISLIYRLKEQIDENTLRYALDKALEVFPYMSYSILEKEGKYFFVENGAKPPISYGKKIVRPVVDREDGPLLTINFTTDQLFVTFAHVLCDAKGATMFAETLLWFYFDKIKGGIKEVPFIFTKNSPEFFEDAVFDKDAATIDFDINQLYEKSYELPFIGKVEEDVGVISQVRFDKDSFIGFARKNNTSPTTALFLLFSEALADLYPDSDKDGVMSADVMVDTRKALGVENTIKNSLSIARVLISREELKEKNFEENAAKVRQQLKCQTTKECINYKHFNGYNYVPPTFLMSYVYNRSGIEFIGEYISDFVLTESGTRKIDYAVINDCFTINILFDDESEKVLLALLKVLERHSIPYYYTTVRKLMEEV